MKAYLLISALAFITLSAFGQSDLTAVDLRKVTGTGPYPLYINAKAHINPFLPLYKNLRKEIDSVYDIENGNGDLGFEVDLGVSVRGKKNILGKNVHGFEVGYQFMKATVHKNDTFGMNLTYGHVALKYAWRHNILYPITCQITPGILLFGAEKLHKFNYTLNMKDEFSNRSSLRFIDKGFSGLEIGGKLMFLDPAGSDGDLGYIVLEVVYQYYFSNSFDITSIKDFYGLDNYNEEPRQMLMIGLGIVLPIAIRF